MLRVYSILYLEKVWTQSSTQAECVSTSGNEAPIRSPLNAIACEEAEQAVDSSFGVDTTPTSNCVQQVEDTVSVDSGIIRDQHTRVASKYENENNDTATIGTETSPSVIMGELSSSSSSLNTNILSPIDSSSPSETPIIQHHQDEFDNDTTITNNMPILCNDREYYDDDISSDIDDEEPLTPPMQPRQPHNKFSAKRMLHRARSSINDESVRNLGRRTSLFLEKFHHPSSPTPPPVDQMPPLPPKYNKNTATTATKEISKSLRRQSIKLTGTGKTFSKKIKRVLSFSRSQS